MTCRACLPAARFSLSCGAIVLACVLLAVLARGAWAAGDANMPTCPQATESSPGFRSYLPDCRAYELVTPPYTSGATVEAHAVSEDGSRLIGYSLGAFAGDESSVFGSFYEFTRTPAGWSATPIDPPASDPSFVSSEYIDASSDLSETLWEAAGELYRREESPGAQARFSEIGPTESGYRGASADLSHILVNREGQLAEYAGAGNDEPRLVGVSNEGPLDGEPHVNEAAQLISRCGAELGSAGDEDTYNAISSTGEVVFFTALHGGCTDPSVNELYARVNGERTLDISEPLLPAGEQCTGACASAPRSQGVFQGASADGSKVFFLTEQPLLNADRDSTTDLYEAELHGGAVRRLLMVSEGETQGPPTQDDPTPGEGAHVLGVVRVSEDGSHVYFVAGGLLTRAPNEEGALPVPGARNLYVFDTLTGRTAFVGTLQSEAQELAAQAVCSSLPSQSAEGRACRHLRPLRIWSSWDDRAAQATPDGRFLVFLSSAHLTADDSSGPLAPQLFRYDAQDGELVRASIGDDGFAQDGNSTLAVDAPWMPEQGYGYLFRPTETASGLDVTEEGAVFFTSAYGLAPQALSGPSSVYEYVDGNVHLISDGQDTTVNSEGQSSVALSAVDGSGDDVFFQTADRLLPQATGTQAAWYDARVDGGFPATASPVQCGEACQNPGEFTPILGASPSASYTDGENAAASLAVHVDRAPLTRAQKLARALRACRLKRGRQRTACQRRARTLYGARRTKAAGRARGRR